MNFIEAMNFRYACRTFDPTKKVSAADQKAIIEFGRLSPSSFGMEPWYFVVINDLKLREKIKPACSNQPQITEAAFVVLYLSRLPNQFRRNSDFMRSRVLRGGADEKRAQNFQNIIIDYLSEQNTLDWAKRQVYIALANMMTGAASLGIDSAPMEGFSPDLLRVLLQDRINWNVFEPAVLCAFGYRKGAPTPKVREPFDKICSIL